MMIYWGICLIQVLFLIKIRKRLQKDVAFYLNNWYINDVQMVRKYKPVPGVYVYLQGGKHDC